MSQQDRILDLLKLNGRLCNYDLRALQPPIFQYPVRIKELIDQGQPIIAYRDKTDKRKYWYQYVHPQKDLFDNAKPV